jgi:hypothetical protein
MNVGKSDRKLETKRKERYARADLSPGSPPLHLQRPVPELASGSMPASPLSGNRGKSETFHLRRGERELRHIDQNFALSTST